MRARGNKPIPDFRDTPAPVSGTRSSVLTPNPPEGGRAHSFTKQDLTSHIASFLDEDDLEAFEADLRRMRG